MNAIRSIFNSDFWIAKGVSDSGSAPLVTLILIAVFGALMTIRLRRFCQKWEELLSADSYKWRLIALTLIRRSILVIGAVLFLLGYDLIQFPRYELPFLRFIISLLIIVLYSRWLLVFLDIWRPDNNCQNIKPAISQIRVIIIGLGIFATIYAIILLSLKAGDTFLFGLRLLLGVAFLVWAFYFWKTFKLMGSHTDDQNGRHLTATQSSALLLTYLVPVGGLVMEFSGHQSLSVYWYKSWANTVVVLFWAVVAFQVIKEWHGDYREASQDIALPDSGSAHPIQLLFIQVAWLLWIFSVPYGLVLAWSTNVAVLRAFTGFLSQPWTIGKISLSLASIIYAFLILFFTYTLTRIVGYTLEEKVFTKSRMEPGLKASILAISVYLLWGLGLIFALGILGVSATSLAVVFGALSIGIGFGLQTIFNNFVSGIILLIERPIQVGDAVEINGICG